jgi:hypothetical protein
LVGAGLPAGPQPQWRVSWIFWEAPASALESTPGTTSSATSLLVMAACSLALRVSTGTAEAVLPWGLLMSAAVAILLTYTGLTRAALILSSRGAEGTVLSPDYDARGGHFEKSEQKLSGEEGFGRMVDPYREDRQDTRHTRVRAVHSQGKQHGLGARPRPLS